LSPESKRARSGTLSAQASGFDYARRHLPLSVVELAADAIFTEAQALLGSDSVSSGWYLIDGSSLTLESTPSLKKAFPPRAKSGGPSRWPVLKFAVAHDLLTGLALRPEVGPMYGSDAVSEQELAYRLLERIPKGCGVIADRNFGILQVAWALRDRPMLLRLTEVRANSMLKGRADLNEDIDMPYVWQASGWEKSHHKELKDAAVSGRIVSLQVLGPKGQPVHFCVFTNDLSSTAEELVHLYTKRWNVETDLRTLKHTLDMETAGAQSPDMVVKELILGVAAYNIVRTVMAQAAHNANLEPRQLSFTRAKACIEIFATRGPINEQAIDEMLRLIAGRIQPKRKPKRSYPRQVWTRTRKYPERKKT
jgi:hypothetical protein